MEAETSKTKKTPQNPGPVGSVWNRTGLHQKITEIFS